MLHSGPWVLALIAASIWFVSSKGHPSWLAAWVGGLATGPIFIVLATIRARMGRGRLPLPLTPERLAQKRSEFYLLSIALFAIAGMVAGMSEQWSTPSPSIALIVVCTLAGLAAGALYALIMWQWFGTALEIAEKKRQRRAAQLAKDA